MLPDFPKVRKFADEILMRWFQRRMFQKTGIMQDIIKEVMHEGNRVELHRYDGTISKVSIGATESEFRLEKEEFEKKGLGAVIEAMDKTAADMAKKQSELFFQQLDEIVEETGQKIDAKGRPLSLDLFLETLEMMPIDFDENGEPLMPAILSSPSFKEKFDRLEETDEQRERFEELIERKRSDWRERESDRKLVG